MPGCLTISFDAAMVKFSAILATAKRFTPLQDAALNEMKIFHIATIFSLNLTDVQYKNLKNAIFTIVQMIKRVRHLYPIHH